jgi:hypothetical protein
MNQMGHGIPILVGVDPAIVDDTLAKVVPTYMDESGADEEVVPRNSIPMLGGPGPFGYVTMGGMFAIVKVREMLPAGDVGWYEHPPGKVANAATAEDLAKDDIKG